MTSRVQSLAEACLAAVLSKPLRQDARALLQSQTFPVARSLRVALPLGRAAGCGVVFVSSDLRQAHAAPTFWATPTERSLVGSALGAGRTVAVEGPGIHRFADLHQLSETEGAASFLCVPVLLAAPPLSLTPRTPAAVLLLSYSADNPAPDEELRLALLLAGELSRQHSKELHSFALRLQTALNPPEHARWGPGVDPLYPQQPTASASSDEEGSSSSPSSAGAGSSAGSFSSELGGGSGGGLRRRRRRREALQGGGGGSGGGSGGGGGGGGGGAAAPTRWCMSPQTLKFVDERLEKRYTAWRNARLERMDAAALLALLLYHSACLLLPDQFGVHSGTRLCSSLLSAATALIPLLLLGLSRSHTGYSRHRDQLLIVTYVLLACHQALDLAAQLTAAPAGIWRLLLLRMEAAWCVALGVILQVQFVGQCLMLVGGLVLKVLLQQGCYNQLTSQAAASLETAGGSAADSCFLDGFVRTLLLKVVLPCGLAYYLELSARRAFAVRTSR